MATPSDDDAAAGAPSGLQLAIQAAGTPSAAAAGAPSDIEIAIQQLLREAKEPHISWHIVLNNHASQRPKQYGGPLCASVKACKQFGRIGSMHSCRIVLPNSYAPGDGKVVQAEASAQDKHTAEEDVGCVAFARLCADTDGLHNVIFRPAHWNVPTEALKNHIRGILELWRRSSLWGDGFVHQRAAASGAPSAAAPSASASGAPSDVEDASGPETRVFPDGGDRADLSDFWHVGPGRRWARPS